MSLTLDISTIFADILSRLFSDILSRLFCVHCSPFYIYTRVFPLQDSDNKHRRITSLWIQHEKKERERKDRNIWRPWKKKNNNISAQTSIIIELKLCFKFY